MELYEKRIEEANNIPKGCNCVIWLNEEACYGNMTYSEIHIWGGSRISSTESSIIYGHHE